MQQAEQNGEWVKARGLIAAMVKKVEDGTLVQDASEEIRGEVFNGGGGGEKGCLPATNEELAGGMEVLEKRAKEFEKQGLWRKASEVIIEMKNGGVEEDVMGLKKEYEEGMKL